MQFPEYFKWGAASASYQVEGHGKNSGIGPSVWDLFCATPGKVMDGHTGAVACDHYHRFREDVALMGEIGIKAYRFSISWPRLLPDGRGRVNPKGKDFYNRLVDTLLEAGIEPWVTLFHWDYPLALYDRGGWRNPDSPYWFSDYAHLVVELLSDRVSHWFTLNEPQVTVSLGHRKGIHAPGQRLTDRELMQVCHHHLVAHGLAVQAIRLHSVLDASVGAAPVGIIKAPASNSEEDLEAARMATFGLDDPDYWCMTPYTDPMILGTYPKALHPLLPDKALEELDFIRQPLDFFGTNIYHCDLVESDGEGGWRNVLRPEGHPRTSMDWYVTPEALYWGPKFLHERYGLPIVITENGMANNDWVAADGGVHDPQRIDYTRKYLLELGRAASDGVPVHGYFHWTIMDNFEWEKGYTRRFGLIHVDYPTGKRTLKDSARWYRDVIRSNGSTLSDAGT